MSNSLSDKEKKRRDAIVKEFNELSPDILCLLEGPKGEDSIDRVTNDLLDGEWVAVKSPDGIYDIKGNQWIWFFVRKKYKDKTSLLQTKEWDSLAGKSWGYHPWGEFKEKRHSHFRHPQVLVLDWDGFRVEFIGLHLKSKFINNGKTMWKEDKEQFIREALSARIKMTTEATNVRAYIDAKFKDNEKPAIFVMGDFNDGPGKEYFEEKFLFFDLISNIQGDIFYASRFLNHALFDFPDNLKWTVYFKDFVDPDRNPHILLDHILFTQGLVDGSLSWKINAYAGKIEHEIHDLINSPLPEGVQTSDHRPVSLVVTISD
ncbi:MAG: endonuclease/exonuclease/phosphatase family protein [Nitrospirota bacterium]